MQQLWLIPTIPLAGAAINGLFGRRLPKAVVNAVAIGSVLLSFLWVLKVLSGLGIFGHEAPEHAYVEHYFTWIQSGALNIGFDLRSTASPPSCCWSLPASACSSTSTPPATWRTRAAITGSSRT